MARRLATSAIIALLLARHGLAAEPARPAAEQAKIDFLLNEVKKSVDVFVRNGREYSGARAGGHLATKLRFAGKRVQTATDFILGIASKSEETGKLYEVRTREGLREPLRDWLLARLQLHEKARPNPTPTRPVLLAPHGS
ncbi:MAG: DUF5329 family protein [Acidobacteriota bacterium]